jgi:preprotein translocase subunit SecA
LAGRAVHLITTNDYLAERDAREMGPIYAGLGLTVGCVTQGLDVAARRAAYRADVVYVTPKQLMFDYLRDRIRLGPRAGSRLRTELAVLRATAAGQRPSAGDGQDAYFLRGLQVAVIDEADSVLIDEAVVPLIISRQEVAPDQADVAARAILLGQSLVRGRDFGIAATGRDLWLTEAGRTRLGHLAGPIGGIFASRLWREQFAEQALTALHLFERDRDYITRDGIIEIVDINTGRTMPDRSWERGLHQMIQAKEGLDVTAPNEALARVSHQSFFRRYHRLCGMSGTLREVAGEIRSVYGVAVRPLPTHHPLRRQHLGVQIVRTLAEKDDVIASRVGSMLAISRPVLIGTRTVADSERLSTRLTALAIRHRVLNARHDAEEAEIIAAAGRTGAVTVATNMAGRGTDIRLDPAVRAAGGLHVIASERHNSRRIDRQLFGRAGRQGDPGSYEEILSLEDSLLRQFVPAWLVAAVNSPALADARVHVMHMAQWRASRSTRRVRSDLSTYEERMEHALAFAGRIRG